MSGAQLRQIRHQLGFSQRTLGLYLGYSDGSPDRRIRELESRERVPLSVEFLLEYISRHGPLPPMMKRLRPKPRI